MTRRELGPVQVPTVADLAEIRERFVHWLTAVTTAGDGQIDDLAIVVSELGANAIQATPDGQPPPTIHGNIADTTLRIETCNHTDAQCPAKDWDPQDPLRPHGRGLLLVSALTDSVSVKARDSQIIISCAVHLAHGRSSTTA